MALLLTLMEILLYHFHQTVLSYLFIGYKTQKIPVSGKKTVEIILKEDTEMLDEV